MKSLLLFIGILCATSIGGRSMPHIATAADHPHREQAVVEFKGNVRLMGVFLNGQYMIVHDHDLMARGEDCTYVYKLEPGKPDKLVVSFHCIPVARQTTDHFTIRTSLFSRELMIYDVREIQFAGSSEGH